MIKISKSLFRSYKNNYIKLQQAYRDLSCRIREQKLNFYFSQKKNNQNKQKNHIQNKQTSQKSDLLSQNKDLIQRQYEEVNLPGSQRNLSSLSQLQSKILKEGKFDITNPQIVPKMASIKSYAGLQTKGVTEINLGQIKIKADNQVFLSQVDPYNIPQDLNIRFDKQKTLTLVGKQIKKQNNNQKRSNIMKISDQSFQQQSIQQFTQKVFGGASFKYEINKKQIWRAIFFRLPILILFTIPIVDTVLQYFFCLQSIRQIQEVDLKQLNLIKNKYKAKALFQNPNFNNWKRMINHTHLSEQNQKNQELIKFQDQNKQADQMRYVSKRISR